VPRNDPQDNPFAELSIDLDAYATTAALGAKADAANVYTKAQVDAAIASAGSNLVPGTVAGGHAVLANGIVRALKVSAPLRIDPDTSYLEIRLDQAQLDATSQIAALQTAVGTKQGTLTQPGFGTELLYNSTRLKRIAFGQGITGGTDLQPDGSQTIGISVNPNLAVSSLTPPASTPLSVAGGLQVSGLTQLQGLEASGVVAQQVVWVTGGTGAPAPSIMFPGSLALGKWRIRGDEPVAFIFRRRRCDPN
jgi:hypothetical protein